MDIAMWSQFMTFYHYIVITMISIKNLEINKEYVKEKIYKMERNANETNNI